MFGSRLHQFPVGLILKLISAKAVSRRLETMVDRGSRDRTERHSRPQLQLVMLDSQLKVGERGELCVDLQTGEKLRPAIGLERSFRWEFDIGGQCDIYCLMLYARAGRCYVKTQVATGSLRLLDVWDDIGGWG